MPRPSGATWTVTGILIAAALLVQRPATAADPAEARSAREIPLGINLAGIVDHSTELPFHDLFTQARPWIAQAEGKPWGQGEPLELSSQGEVLRLKPGQFATTVMCSKQGTPPGRYVCLYEGQGELSFGKGTRVLRSKPGRIDIQVEEDTSLFLDLKQTSADDPVRNIRIYMPGTTKDYLTQPFRTNFLKRTQQFGAIRFMDWMNTNNSKITSWDERPRPSDFSQATRGVALEYMIALCNKLQREPWFCMPHLADDDYVREFARQVKQDLSPGLRVYIEYSNEVWNTTFEQARYARERGLAMKLGASDYEAQLRFASLRSVETFKIWEQEFAGTDRLVRVLGSQSVNPWVSEQVITFEDAYKSADAVAIAPYFGNSLGDPKAADKTARLSVKDILERCRADIEASSDYITKTARLARRYKLDLIAYEGGQHLVGHGGAENNEQLMELFYAANRSLGMRELYKLHLDTWKRSGGRQYFVFSSVSQPSKWGSWGLLESELERDANAPKLKGVRDFLKETPTWW